MAAQADIPYLTNSDKAWVFQTLDAQLNSVVLYVLLHGAQRRSVP